MFHRDGLCEYCNEERWATITIQDKWVQKEICMFCLEEKFDEKYKKEK